MGQFMNFMAMGMFGQDSAGNVKWPPGMGPAQDSAPVADATPVAPSSTAAPAATADTSSAATKTTSSQATTPEPVVSAQAADTVDADAAAKKKTLLGN